MRETVPEQPVSRNVAIDAYRGLVMLLMMAEVLQLSRVAAAYPTSFFWKILAFNQTHVEWFGCSLHDTIQPGSLSLSVWRCRTRLPVALRRVRAFKELFWHALWRSLVLVALGVFLRSMATFHDVLHVLKIRCRRSGSDTRSCSYSDFIHRKPDGRSGYGLRWAVVLVGYWVLWAGIPAAPGEF